ncbi:MAG: two component transcriptional regulator, AraC family [Anaerosporomusa subterranea]|nr:two component transcriptional regulator, AraC family [Anaerosporomusa subterranea]
MFTILIVDDEKWVRSVLRLTIEEIDMPFRVIKECEDAEEALLWLESHAADLVITDIRMPGMDGLTFTKEVRRRGVQQDFIVISMYDDFHLVQEALRLGVFDYLLKPIQITEVEACFEKWVNARELKLESQTTKDKKSGSVLISKVLQFIETTPLSEVNLSKAAKHVHISPSYLSAIFKQQLNMNFVDYLTRLRIRESKRSLAKTEMTIADIAERMGYSDLPYFCNFFKKEMGCTPSEYRHKCRKVMMSESMMEK